MATKLSLQNLEKIGGTMAVPSYSRDALSPGILHIGIGNFHRAHQATYLDQLFSKGIGQDWAIIGAGVLKGDCTARNVLQKQDWLTTIVEREANSSRAHVIGSMIDYIDPADPQAIIAGLVDPRTRIVSLTITEGGYFLDANDNFDAHHPAVVADAENPGSPKTVFGLIIAGLRKRRDAGTPPFTVMCCDNIPHNGNVTRSTLCSLAAMSDQAMADWIAENVAFPNSMVDRITPATSDRERAVCREEFGIDDSWPVFCEEFTQWVMEDHFPIGRPPLEQVGVQFVEDVTPFELMKLRVLNGGHAIIAYCAGLLDIQFVHEAMAHPVIGAYLRKIEETEIVPQVPPVPDTDASNYFDLIERRFSNPKIADTVRRLCFDGYNRQPKFVVPVLRDALRSGGKFDGLALECALWCRYCYGVTESGAEIAPNDPHWDRLVSLSRKAKNDPTEWLTLEDVYGDVAANPEFRNRFSNWLDMLWQQGTEETMGTYLSGE
ncbi:MAG: mannitol dehydrogenase family protein [Alphaproteobacteria bacterium]|nr:mannitol dehydrogenase family protein [Alphaproteobacteria bacterium]